MQGRELLLVLQQLLRLRLRQATATPRRLHPLRLRRRLLLPLPRRRLPTNGTGLPGRPCTHMVLRLQAFPARQVSSATHGRVYTVCCLR